MRSEREPAEFAEILNSAERPLIVGGQAVNVWAEYYSATNTRLAAQRPFVSKDADILGDRAMAARLAKVPGWKVTYFHEPRTIAVAVLTKETPGQPTLTVEILREVRGLTHKELGDSDLVELRPGQIYRIPSPIRLLKAKLANLAGITPTRDQDIRHARLLVTLARDYLVEQHRNVAAGRLSERQWINAFHELREMIGRPAAQKLDQKFALQLANSIPQAVPHADQPKIAALYQHLRPKKKNGPGFSP